MIALGQVFGDGVVLLDQRAPGDLGGMRGQHQLDVQPADLAGEEFAGVPGLLQAFEQLRQGDRFEGFGLVRPAPADAVVLLGDVARLRTG